MKVILSPAMNMGSCDNEKFEKTVPIFKKRANELAKTLKKLDPFELEIALSVSPKLIEKVFEHYSNFDCVNKNNKGAQALLAFQGLAYKNINPEDFTREDFEFANKTLRIFSAMYGVLKPSDVIQQYRLDFMCNFGKKSINNENLYKYWDKDIYNEIFKEDELVIGICSKEYEKLIKPFLKPSDKYLYCNFLINKDGKFKAYATASKMARGQMARFIVKNKIEDIELLKEFDYDGFKYSEYHSNERELVFIK